jgi:hypothetical protein
MIPKSMPSGFDPMGGYRFSVKIMLKLNNLEPSRSRDVEFPLPAGREKFREQTTKND